MEQFKIRPGGFNEIRKKILIRTIPLMLMAVTVGIGISHFNTPDEANNINVLPFIIPIALLSVGLGIYRGVNRQKILFESYTLSVMDDSMLREQANTPTITIAFGDVTEIMKNSNASFTIKGKTTTDVIVVPAQIDNYEHLEALLNQIKPFNMISKQTLTQKIQVPMIFATLALMATVYLATNKILIGISGTLVSVILTWSFVETQRNENIDYRTKRSSYWTIVVLFSIVGTVIFKLLVS